MGMQLPDQFAFPRLDRSSLKRKAAEPERGSAGKVPGYAMATRQIVGCELPRVELDHEGHIDLHGDIGGLGGLDHAHFVGAAVHHQVRGDAIG